MKNKGITLISNVAILLLIFGYLILIFDLLSGGVFVVENKMFCILITFFSAAILCSIIVIKTSVNGYKTTISASLPDYKDNWDQERFDQNIKNGVEALEKGMSVKLYEDGRGYELALEIKKHFVLKYQQELAAKILIKNESHSVIVVTFKKD